MVKRLAALCALTLALLVGSLARADWHQGGGLSGGPQDTWIADAGGYFAVHTTSVAYRMLDNGASASTLGSVSSSAIKCSAIVNDKVRAAALTELVDEAAPGSPTALVNTSIFGCRATETAAATFYGDSPSGTNRMFFADAGTFGAVPRFVDVGDQAQAIPSAISAHTVFGRDVSFVARAPGIGSFFVVDGNPVQPYFLLSTPIAPVQRSEVFGARDGGIRAVQVGIDGGQILTLTPSGAVFDSFSLPAPAAHKIRAVTLSELEGGALGAGFGMLLVENNDAGVVNLWRAIPDPDNVGKFWIPSNPQPPAPAVGAYDSVRCVDGTFCVLGSSTSITAGPSQLAIYHNVSTPTVGAPNFTVQEGGGGPQPFTVSATDGDGDAVFVSWAVDPSSTTYFSALAADPTVHDGTTWQGTVRASIPQLCGLAQATVPVTVRVSDGLKLSGPSNGNITVVHAKPGQPGPNQSTALQAGTATATQTFTFAPNGCSVTAGISPASPATATITSANTLDVSFTPPRVWCDDTPDSGTQRFQVSVVDGVVSSPVATATFVVLPWGEPETPFGAGVTRFQDAGTAATYAPVATHLCGDAGTFPGVDTSWTWSASGAGFTPVVLEADAGLLPQGGGISPTATVVVPDCQSGTITFQATNTTRMTGGLTSPASPLTVNVATSLQPLGGMMSITAAPDDGGVSGTVDLNPVQCPQNRSVTGTVELYREDGGFISGGSLSGLPAPYTLPAPGACGGGNFYVSASLTDATGTVGPSTQPVTLPVLGPGFASVTVDPFKITCGDVARGHAQVTFGPTDCPSAQVDWSSAGAVAIASVDAGVSVDLATVSSDFGGLIGVPVQVVATATAETGSVSVPAAPVVVGVDPFVTVEHRTDTAVALESRVLAVEVRLRNTTACDVSGVELHESLQGLGFIPGSVVGEDGGTIEGAGPDGGELLVPGLSLPAGQLVTVRYSARPTLFDDPAPGGYASLRSVPISGTDTLHGGNSSCGCQSASGGATALAGLAAVALLRRRRIKGRS